MPHSFLILTEALSYIALSHSLRFLVSMHTSDTIIEMGSRKVVEASRNNYVDFAFSGLCLSDITLPSFLPSMIL